MTMKPCGRQPQKSSPCRCALRVDRPEARRTEDGGAVVWYGRNWRAAEDVRPYQATTLLRRRAAEDVRPYQATTLLRWRAAEDVRHYHAPASSPVPVPAPWQRPIVA